MTHLLLTIAIASLALALVAALAVFWIRNEWVFEQRTIYTERAYAFIRWCSRHDMSAHDRFDQRLYDALDTYDAMMRRWWVWDVDRLVVDLETYEAVQNHYRQSS